MLIHSPQNPLEFPIYILTKDSELPKENNCYIICKSGVYLKKTNNLIGGIVKVDNLSMLKDLKPEINLNISTIPSSVIFCSLVFFRLIYQIYNSEAVLFILLSQKDNKIKLYCPKQVVSYGHIKYQKKTKFKNFKIIGTIHSHCNFSASHSYVDKLDEANFDGIHITIGNVDLNEFSISVSFVLNNNRILCNPEEKIENIEKINSNSWFSQDKFYKLKVEPEIEKVKQKIIKSWLPKVEEFGVKK
jgi:hypothetical protein